MKLMRPLAIGHAECVECQCIGTAEKGMGDMVLLTPGGRYRRHHWGPSSLVAEHGDRSVACKTEPTDHEV